MAVLAYLLRGLSFAPSGSIKAGGTVKVSWIANVFGLCLRTVRAARRKLIELGWIEKDKCSHQWKLNRHGAYFQVNIGWGKGAPCSQDAPPRKRLETLSEIKNQELPLGEFSGVLKDGREAKPRLTSIKQEDLKKLSRVLMLYQLAVLAGWLRPSDANRLNFIAAAVHATRSDTRYPVRVFVAIVRKGLWHHITAKQEALALRALKRCGVVHLAARGTGRGAQCISLPVPARLAPAGLQRLTLSAHPFLQHCLAAASRRGESACGVTA